jgi:hypothetical protein
MSQWLTTSFRKEWGGIFGHGRGHRADEHRVQVVELPKRVGPEFSALAEKKKKVADLAFREKEQEKENKDLESSRTGKDHGLLFAGSPLVRMFGSMLVGRWNAD